jgi:hypothetical protein
MTLLKTVLLLPEPNTWLIYIDRIVFGVKNEINVAKNLSNYFCLKSAEIRKCIQLHRPQNYDFKLFWTNYPVF